MATGAKDKEASGLSLAKANAIAFRAGRQSGRSHCQSSCPKWDWWKNHSSNLLIDFFASYFDFAIEWVASLPVALVILVKPRGQPQNCLLFDGRLWAVAAAEKTARPVTICWLLERGSGRLLHQYNDLSQFPTMFQFPQQRAAANQQPRSLCELLGLKAGSFADPQNLHELRQCLADHCGGGNSQDSGVTVVQGKDRDVCFSNGCQFVVEAATDLHYRIFYQEPVYRPVKPLRPPLMGTHKQRLEEECYSKSDDGEIEIAEMFRTNRSCATSVRQSGLNLAFSLGVISRQELSSLSCQLGKTAASLALHLDERGHLRHIFYRDAENSFGQTVTCFDEASVNEKGEMRCQDEAVQNMNVFWQKVWTRRQTWGVPARARILKDVLARMERLSVSPCSSLFVKCLKDLKRCVSLQYVVFFSSCDDQIHSFKYYLAHFAHKFLQNKRGLQLKTSSDNNINALVVAGKMSVFNLQAYVNAKDDAEFFGEERWIPPPKILHVAFRSASLLAFESVWTRFAHLGGPLVQGPEKMKPRYAEMLRSASRGGFMFSAKTFIDAGSIDKCQSIMEFDLSSAYGFSASNALMPSGFCTGFVRLKKKEEEEEDDDSFVLEKTDPVRRHKSFEFKAVYFTLRTLMSSRDDIQTVYSNFSPLGLFSLDKYPADLTVVFKNGQIQVYQFDGHFVHGCDTCLALSAASETAASRRKKYAHGQTHEQVRAKTNQRDKVFEEWALSLNAAGTATRVEYFVVSDCHTNGYSSRSLDEAFQRDPVLRALILPYETVSDGLKRRKKRNRGKQSGEGEGGEATECCDGSDLTLSSWLNFMEREESNKSFTCFAWLKGFCSAASAAATLNPAANGCLIIHPPSLRRRRGNKDADSHDSLRGNGCSLSSSATTEVVLLTRDYYQYLVSHHAFVVTELDAVLFFKTEPIFNQIYQELIERRRSSCNPNKKNWTKRLINLSCGFFGLQLEKTGSAGHRSYSIRHRIPSTYNISSHCIDLQHGLSCMDDTQYCVMSFSSFVGRRSRCIAPAIASFSANNALALFVTVVEMGKLRLVQALQFISRHVPSQNWSLLYSNVDNLIISLKGAKSLDEAVAIATNVIDKGNGGGGYVLRDKEDSDCDNRSSSSCPMQRQKIAGLSDLSNQRAFNYAFSLMFGEEPTVVVSQERRVNKLQSMVKQHQEITFRRQLHPSLPPPAAL